MKKIFPRRSGTLGGLVVLSFVFVMSSSVFAATFGTVDSQPHQLNTAIQPHDPIPAPAPAPPPAPLQPRVLSPAQKAAILKRANENSSDDTNSKDDNKSSGLLKSVFSEYGVQFLALVVSLFGVILAVSGFSIANSKKKKHMSTFMNEIDDAFHSFKWKSKRCEAELYRLNDLLEEKLKKGKIDESTFGLLTGRIEKYLKEIQELDSLPEHVRKQRSGD